MNLFPSPVLFQRFGVKMALNVSAGVNVLDVVLSMVTDVVMMPWISTREKAMALIMGMMAVMKATVRETVMAIFLLLLLLFLFLCVCVCYVE